MEFFKFMSKSNLRQSVNLISTKQSDANLFSLFSLTGRITVSSICEPSATVAGK